MQYYPWVVKAVTPWNPRVITFIGDPDEKISLNTDVYTFNSVSLFLQFWISIFPSKFCYTLESEFCYIRSWNSVTARIWNPVNAQNWNEMTDHFFIMKYIITHEWSMQCPRNAPELEFPSQPGVGILSQPGVRIKVNAWNCNVMTEHCFTMRCNTLGVSHNIVTEYMVELW